MDEDRQEGPSRARTRRPGRRPAGAGVDRVQVLQAARLRFAQQGYEGTTLRHVADDVGVDPSLVHYLFGSKRDLFTAAMTALARPPTAIDELLAGGPDQLAERLVRTFLRVWDDPAAAPLAALIRSAATHPDAAALLGEYLDREILSRLERLLTGRDITLRAGLISAHLTGLVLNRHVLRLPPVADADPDTLVRLMAPAIERYLRAP